MLVMGIVWIRTWMLVRNEVVLKQVRLHSTVINALVANRLKLAFLVLQLCVLAHVY